MLSRPRDFATLQRAGTTRSHSLLLARFVRNDLEVVRFGLATGRKLGGAVTRNRLRRRLREVLKALAPDLMPGWDVLIVARPGLVVVRYDELRQVVGGVLARGGVLSVNSGKGR